jgi:hypothetical protein
MTDTNNRRQCVYCGATKNLSLDHVPPRNLFAKPRPSNLVTVPSCTLCNTAASKDDEYFRLMLSMSEDTGDHPDVQGNLPTIVRSLTKINKLGFARSLAKHVSMVELRSQAGLYLESKAAYDVDLERLDRVVGRTVRGLCYHERTTRIPDTCEVRVWSESGLRDVPRETVDRLQRTIIGPLLTVNPKVFGKDVFSYRVQFITGNPNWSAWLLLFYKSIAFLAMTCETARLMPVR